MLQETAKIKTAVEYFDRANKHFIKFFLIDDSVNYNHWQVTAEAIRQDISTFTGKPFILTSKFDHTNGKDVHIMTEDEMIGIEKKFKIGTIIDVGIDHNTGKAFGIAEITDEKAFQIIQDKAMFVSPSLRYTDEDVTQHGVVQVLNRFQAAHVASVKDPAFGIIKAQIKGRCAGTESECRETLKTVQASIKLGGVTHYFAQSDCVEKCLQEKEDRGIPVDDKAIAICLSECDEFRDREGKSKTIVPSIVAVHEPGDGVPKIETTVGTNTSFDTIKHPNNTVMEQTTNLEAQINDLTAKLDTEKAAREEVEKNYKKLHSEFETMARQPFVEYLVSAKITLGTITEEQREEEVAKLNAMDELELKHLTVEYEKLFSARKEVQGSRNRQSPKFLSGSKVTEDSDVIIARLRSAA